MLFPQKSNRFFTAQPHDMMFKEHPECKEWMKGGVNDNNVEPVKTSTVKKSTVKTSTVKASMKPTSRGLQSLVLITDKSLLV